MLRIDFFRRRTVALLFSIAALFLHSSVAVKQAVIDTDPNAFPFCACQRQNGAYTLSSISNPSGGIYCFTVAVNRAPGCTDYCCTTDLYKFEIETSARCFQPGLRLSANLTTRDGATRVLSVPTITPARRSVTSVLGYILKINQLGLDLNTADGANICVKLGTNAAGDGCPTLEELCGTQTFGECTFGLFNKENDCCPGPSVVENKPCTDVCIGFAPDGFTVPPAEFPPSECATAAANLTAYINSLAEAVGAEISAPFALQEPGCTPAAANLPRLCGRFANTSDAELLNAKAGDIAHRMMDLVVGVNTLPGTYSCPLWLPPNTTVSMSLAGIDVGAPVRRRLASRSRRSVIAAPGDNLCLVGSFATNCQSESRDNLTCNCDNAPRSTPFSVRNTTITRPGPRVNSTEYCFTLGTVTPISNPQNPFCSKTANISKFEVEADFNLRGALLGFNFRKRGSPQPIFKAPSWRVFKAGDTELYFAKATGVTVTKTEAAAGAQVCVILRDPTTLQDFCQGPACLVWLFDASRKCCPMWGATI